MGIQNVCKILAKVKELKKDGTLGTEVTVPYYFLGTSAYNDATFATVVGIEMIPADKWDGSHPLIPVAELIQAQILSRLSVVVLAANKKKRRYNVAVSEQLLGKIHNGTTAERLDGKNYKLLNKAGSSVDMGTIIRIGGKTDAFNP
jgi:hypothetical protein